MDPLERGTLMIIRLIAGTCILVTVMDLSLYVVVRFHDQKPVEILPCVVKSLPMLVGVVLFVKTKALCRWICDQLE
jgi:hypothetical protein